MWQIYTKSLKQSTVFVLLKKEGHHSPRLSSGIYVSESNEIEEGRRCSNVESKCNDFLRGVPFLDSERVILLSNRFNQVKINERN